MLARILSKEKKHSMLVGVIPFIASMEISVALSQEDECLSALKIQLYHPLLYTQMMLHHTVEALVSHVHYCLTQKSQKSEINPDVPQQENE